MSAYLNSHICVAEPAELGDTEDQNRVLPERYVIVFMTLYMLCVNIFIILHAHVGA